MLIKPVIRRRVGTYITWTAVAVCCLGSTAGIAAGSAASPEAKTFDVRPQPVAAALKSFADQAGMQLIFTASEVGSLDSAGVHGALSAHEALTKILHGTGLSYEITPNDVIIVRGPRTLSRLTGAGGAGASIEDPPVKQAGTTAPPSEPVAEESTDLRLQEVVVTAQKRQQNLQQVPIAVTAIGAEALQAGSIDGVRDLKLVAPSVEVHSNNGYALPVIRGVGSKATGPGIENPTAIYVDGVYYAAATSALLGFSNIQQVEVLKGPQGTLFGRNATAGLIQITTRDPKQEFGGNVDVSYGNYQTTEGTLYVTGGVTDSLAGDFSAVGTTMGEGYGRNLYNGKDVYQIQHDVAERSKWLLTMGDKTEARLILDYEDARHNLNAQRIVPGATVPAPYGPTYGGGFWDIDSDVQPLVTMRTGGASLKIDQDLGSGYRFTSISAYRFTHFHLDVDYDYTATRGRELDVRQDDSQFSQELQLLSPVGDRLNWVAGAFYFKAPSRYDPFNIFLYGPSQAASPIGLVARRVTESEQDTDSIAGFGQATVRLVDRLNATVGVRYTSEKRTLRDATQFDVATSGATRVTFPLTNLSERFNKVTWRFALDYAPTDDSLTYISWNRGFKSGGYNPATLSIPPFAPEVLDAYEIGWKSTWLEQRLRFNSATYFYNYKDVQVSRAATTGTGIYNGEGAHIYGAEFEFEGRITRQFTATAGYQYTHGRYLDFPGAQIATPRPAGGVSISTGDAVGNTTVLSPPSVFSVAGNYTIPLGQNSLRINTSYYYNAGFFHEPDNYLKQDAYHLVNSSLRWESPKNLSVTLWGKNLTDAAVANISGIQTFGAVGAARINYAPPRTYGITVGKEF